MGTTVPRESSSAGFRSLASRLFAVLDLKNRCGEGTADEGTNQIQPEITETTAPEHRMGQDRPCADGRVERAPGDWPPGKRPGGHGETDGEAVEGIA